jgi:hypothetical protein
MVRRPEFRVVSPRRKPDLIERPRKPQPPSVDIEHRILGIGRLMGLRPSGSGGFVCDVKFGSTTRTLKLEQPYWITLVADIIALAPNFPAPKPKAETTEKKSKSAAEEEEEGEVEELSAEGAFRAREDEAEDGEGEESALEEIA